MKCDWNALLAILPQSIRSKVDGQGKDTLQELRLRINKPTELVTVSGSKWLNSSTSSQDIQFVVNTASRYSPWTASTMAKGYITAPGGHRIGLCGEVVQEGGQVCGMWEITSLCIRVARDFPGIGDKVPAKGNILILGPPGSGKTTLLRDIARRVAATETITVVDERGELFPEGFEQGQRMDVIRGCNKQEGIEMALRTMGPAVIAVDEITAEEDCAALSSAAWCGVRLLATAHAFNGRDLEKRPVYRPICQQNLFDTILTLRTDKSWYTERMISCC